MIHATLEQQFLASFRKPKERSALDALRTFRVPLTVLWTRTSVIDQVTANVKKFSELQNKAIQDRMRPEDKNGIGPGHPEFEVLSKQIAELAAKVEPIEGDAIPFEELGQGDMSPQEFELLRGWLVAEPVAPTEVSK